MKRLDQNKRTHTSSKSSINILNDPKIEMTPIVFTKKLDKMDSINKNWEPLSFKKIITMLHEESKPEYNISKISTSTVIDIKSYNKLENKLETYIQSTKIEYRELNLKRIIEMALNNIRTSPANLHIQKETSQSSKTVKTETKSWSSDDDEALVSIKRRKIKTPNDNHWENKSENMSPNKSQKNKKSVALTVKTPIKSINKNIGMKKCKAQVKPKKAMTTVAEVQSQLKYFVNNAPIKHIKAVTKIDDKLVKVKRRQGLSKNVDNKCQKKNQTEVPTTPNVNTKIDPITTITENQSQKENQTKAPAQQNKKKRPTSFANADQNMKKKKRTQDVGEMSIFFLNTGLMAKQQKVTEERYDIGKDGTLQKFFIQSQPPRDSRRYSIEKTVCCLYKRAQVITEILDEYYISPTAINFLRAAHLCEVGACLCCCKSNRSGAQTDTVSSSRKQVRNVENSVSSDVNTSFSGSSLQNRNAYDTNKIVKNISAHYKLSIALKGLITSLLTNFKGITLTAGSTGKLSAVFNTTFTSWNNTDLQLMTTILTKMKRELFVSQIPPKDFCDCVNEALNKDNLYSQASSLLGSKQLLIMNQYSSAHFSVENQIITKPGDPNMEYFRGDIKLLQNPGPSSILNSENEENKTGRQKTIRNDEREKDGLSKKPKKGLKIGNKRETKNKSPEALRECVFVPESTTEESTVVDYTVPNKNPLLHQLLVTSAESTLPDYGVNQQQPLQYIVSLPVSENPNEQLTQNDNLETDNFVTIDLSDEESILP